MNLTPKQIGDTNQKARAAAVETLAKYQGKDADRLKPMEKAELLTALLQWLGLADKNGIIK